MKVIVQRVSHAHVDVDAQTVGKIEKGFLVLFGAQKGDTFADATRLAKKVCMLRIFEDENEKINLSLADVGGELLVISQFTLLADTSHGNRPSFFEAMPPKEAEEMYEFFCKESCCFPCFGISYTAANDNDRLFAAHNCGNSCFNFTVGR